MMNDYLCPPGPLSFIPGTPMPNAPFLPAGLRPGVSGFDILGTAGRGMVSFNPPLTTGLGGVGGMER